MIASRLPTVGRDGSGYTLGAVGTSRFVEARPNEQQLAMLHILYGACSAALNAFKAADNPIDQQLVLDLEAMVVRTRGEIDRLAALLAGDAA